MTDLQTSQALEAVAAAKKALVNGDHALSHHYARQAVQYDPNLEESWLVMAATASPEASVEYLQRVLAINPTNIRAQKGLQWAIQRKNGQSTVQTDTLPGEQVSLEGKSLMQSVEIHRSVRDSATKTGKEFVHPEKPSIPSIPAKQLTQRSGSFVPWILLLMVLCIGAVGMFVIPPLVHASSAGQSSTLPAGLYEKPTLTPTPTPTFTPTPTPTITPSPTPTETPYPTDTPLPTVTPSDETYVYEPDELPDVGKRERWIDVDLTNQSVIAYEGDTPVNTFIVSTGTWAHPTVTGQFHIYVKYRYTDMEGPGYYLPDVPYTMYFYDGYGLHGTYWHSNFGTPMSHGCINLRTEDAAWLYNWAKVGTMVNIHY